MMAVFCLTLAGCGDEVNYKIGDDDKAFVAKIKTHLQDVGDTVKVADIHPGEWEEVCINPVGVYGNPGVRYIRHDDGSDSWHKIEVINGPKATMANDRIWGIYFRYPGDKIEYYRISVYEMLASSGCVPRDTAVMNVRETSKDWGIGNKAEKSQDFINIKLMTLKEKTR
jgi:hypothetical protein